MSFRNPLDVFHYDQVSIQTKNVVARDTVVWSKLADLPEFTIGWRIHNRGEFDIRYGYQKEPTSFEILDAGVADSKSYIPRELWVANTETETDRDSLVMAEYWVPEREDDRKDGESTGANQLRIVLAFIRRLWGGN